MPSRSSASTRWVLSIVAAATWLGCGDSAGPSDATPDTDADASADAAFDTTPNDDGNDRDVDPSPQVDASTPPDASSGEDVLTPETTVDAGPDSVDPGIPDATLPDPDTDLTPDTDIGAEDTVEDDGTDPEEPDPLADVRVFVTAEQLEFLRTERGAQVVDSRAARNFADGHIPGSIRLQHTAFTEPGRNGLVWEDASVLQDIARTNGLRDDVPVVVYGNWGDGASSTARTFWTLHYLGHEEVYLLNGALPDWEALGVPVATDVVAPEPTTFTVRLQPELRVTLDEVIDIVTSQDPNVILVDTRTLGEWEGDDLRNNPRGGHIPTAVHLHWLDLFDGDVLRSREENLAILASVGITASSIVVPYCQSGVRSAFLYALLLDLGFRAPRNYDGSFWEWSRTEEQPVIVPVDAPPPSP